MSTERYSPNQFLTDLPLEAVREVVWRVFEANGYSNAVIDPSKNVVGGYNKSNFFSNGDAALATFGLRHTGTLVNINVRPSIPGAVDFGKSKRKGIKIVDEVIAQLSGSVPTPIGPVDQMSLQKAAPLADPSGAVAPRQTGNPMYGHVGPVPVGTHILINSLVLVCICQVLSVFNVIAAIKALKEYGSDDPGDKALVIAGLVISSLVSLGVLAYIGLIIMVMSSN